MLKCRIYIVYNFSSIMIQLQLKQVGHLSDSFLLNSHQICMSNNLSISLCYRFRCKVVKLKIKISLQKYICTKKQ